MAGGRDWHGSPLEQALDRYLGESSEERLQGVMAAGGGLVHHFARLYAGDRPRDDLLQAGYEGLLKAVQRFNPDRGVLFATFASHCIMGEMRHQLRLEASFDRPGWLADLQASIYRAMDELLQQTNRPPVLSDIARAVNIREEGVLQVLRAGRVSIEELDLSSITHRQYENFQLTIEDRIAVRQAMESLCDLQRRVVYLIFYQDLTQVQVAREMGIGQRRVSRLLSRGLALLKQYLV